MNNLVGAYVIPLASPVMSSSIRGSPCSCFVRRKDLSSTSYPNPPDNSEFVSINVGSSQWSGVRAVQPHWITADELIVASRDTTVLIVHADVGH